MRLKALLFITLLFIALPLAAQRRVVFQDSLYDPFYSLTLVDSAGDSYELHGSAFYDLEDQEKFFLWVRRGTAMGIVTYTLELDRIAEIEFTGPYGSPDEYYTPAVIRLVDGSEHDVYVGTAGYLGGFDPSFGSYGKIYLNYNMVQSIVFHHQGEYQRCPHCGTIFFDDERTSCPFDGFELESQLFIGSVE